MSNLALAYVDAGRPGDAFLLFEETLKRQKIKLGLDHPDTLLTMNNLGNMYTDDDRPTEAVALHEETLRRRKAKIRPPPPRCPAIAEQCRERVARSRQVRRCRARSTRRPWKG